jgi:hypothetical protein
MCSEQAHVEKGDTVLAFKKKIFGAEVERSYEWDSF